MLNINNSQIQNSNRQSYQEQHKQIIDNVQNDQLIIGNQDEMKLILKFFYTNLNERRNIEIQRIHKMFVSKFDFFNKLSQSGLDNQVIQCMKLGELIHIKKGQIIHLINDEPDSFCLILKGQVLELKLKDQILIDQERKMKLIQKRFLLSLLDQLNKKIENIQDQTHIEFDKDYILCEKLKEIQNNRRNKRRMNSYQIPIFNVVANNQQHNKNTSNQQYTITQQQNQIVQQVTISNLMQYDILYQQYLRKNIQHFLSSLPNLPNFNMINQFEYFKFVKFEHFEDPQQFFTEGTFKYLLNQQIHSKNVIGIKELVNQQKNQSTMICQQDCQLLVWKKSDFENLFEKLRHQKQKKKIQFISKVFGDQIDIDIISRLFYFIKKDKYSARHIICQESQNPKNLFIIRKGDVELFLLEKQPYNKNQEKENIFVIQKMENKLIPLAMLNAGEMFGEFDIIEQNTNQSFTAIVRSDQAVIYSLSKEKLLEYMNYYSQLKSYFITTSQQKSQAFKNLYNEKIQFLNSIVPTLFASVTQKNINNEKQYNKIRVQSDEIFELIALDQEAKGGKLDQEDSKYLPDRRVCKRLKETQIVQSGPNRHLDIIQNNIQILASQYQINQSDFVEELYHIDQYSLTKDFNYQQKEKQQRLLDFKEKLKLNSQYSDFFSEKSKFSIQLFCHEMQKKVIELQEKDKEEYDNQLKEKSIVINSLSPRQLKNQNLSIALNPPSNKNLTHKQKSHSTHLQRDFSSQIGDNLQQFLENKQEQSHKIIKQEELQSNYQSNQQSNFKEELEENYLNLSKLSEFENYPLQNQKKLIQSAGHLNNSNLQAQEKIIQQTPSYLIIGLNSRNQSPNFAENFIDIRPLSQERKNFSKISKQKIQLRKKSACNFQNHKIDQQTNLCAQLNQNLLNQNLKKKSQIYFQNFLSDSKFSQLSKQNQNSSEEPKLSKTQCQNIDIQDLKKQIFQSQHSYEETQINQNKYQHLVVDIPLTPRQKLDNSQQYNQTHKNNFSSPNFKTNVRPATSQARFQNQIIISNNQLQSNEQNSNRTNFINSNDQHQTNQNSQKLQTKDYSQQRDPCLNKIVQLKTVKKINFNFKPCNKFRPKPQIVNSKIVTKRQIWENYLEKLNQKQKILTNIKIQK